MKRYRVSVIDDVKQVVRAFADLLRNEGFEVEGFDEGEKFLTATFGNCFPARELPEVVLVDLQLKIGKMKGIELVADLASRKNFDSAIMVMSGNATSEEMVKAIKIGASAAAPKPFDQTVIPTIQRLAEMTRRRRIYRSRENSERTEIDASRFHRPVFLSYSGRDDVLANGLRRNIEARGISVWYAPTTIPAGDPWRSRVETGIKEANIFLALLTDNYILNSRHCPAEFAQFQERIANAKEPKPLILPVVSGLTSRARRSSLYRQFDEVQFVDISSNFTDGLTTLLLRIEGYLKRLPPSLKPKGKQSVTISDRVFTFPSHSEESFS